MLSNMVVIGMIAKYFISNFPLILIVFTWRWFHRVKFVKTLIQQINYIPFLHYNVKKSRVPLEK